MFPHEVSSLSFWVVAIMICVVLLVMVAQISHFYAAFKASRRESEAHLVALAAQLKQMQTTLSELLGETRRGNRLTLEMVELKQAEMTGDFEIVEEEVPTAKPAPPEPPPPPPLSEPPRSFPKL